MNQQMPATSNNNSAKTAKNKLPLILTTRLTRGSEQIKVNCEPSDAENYQQYIQFSYECQGVKGQYSQQELEVRFNALAWNAIWKRDAAFREWMKTKVDKTNEAQS